MRIIAGILIALWLCLPFPAPAEAEARQNRALLIGMDLFVTLDSTYPSSANNVQDMYRALLHSAIPFAQILTPDEPVTTVQALGKWIQKAFGEADADDCNTLYISTHGAYDDAGNMALLLSDGVTESRLTAAELEALFQGVSGTNILLLDACYSGAFIGKGMREPPPAAAFQNGNFKVLTSSGAMEESWYWNGRSDGAQGSFYFTQILTQGISPLWNYPADGNRDGSITLAELTRYLLTNHGASTPQVYPQEDDTVVFAYDPDAELSGDRSPVVDITFSDDLITADQSLTLAFTALRPVRVAYQIVYRRDGRWQFDEAELVYDEAERFTALGDLAGAILPGRKERTITLQNGDDDLYGYVLVQVLTLENGALTLQTGHLITVTPPSGALSLSASAPERFTAGEGAEMPIFVEHSLPCALGVTVVNSAGESVRRLCYRSPSRPLSIVPDGSCFYWNGRGADGAFVPEGDYRVLVEAWIGDALFTAQSGDIRITR